MAIRIMVRFFRMKIVFSRPCRESQKVSNWMMAGKAIPMVARQRAPMREMKSSRLGIAAARTTENMGNVEIKEFLNL